MQDLLKLGLGLAKISLLSHSSDQSKSQGQHRSPQGNTLSLDGKSFKDTQEGHGYRKERNCGHFHHLSLGAKTLRSMSKVS